MELYGARSDPGVRGVLERLDLPGVRDLGIVVDHGEGHPVSRLAAEDDDAAARKLRALFPQTGYWPLLLLEDIAFESQPAIDLADALAQGWRREDLVTGVQAVELAAGLTIEEAPYAGFFGGRTSSAVPQTSEHEVRPHPKEAAILGEGWSRRHGLLLVPAQAPAESLAYVGFGGRNESPADAGHVRFHRYLWEICDGAVTGIGYSRMNVEMPKPVHDKATAILLADRLFEYCGDLETVMADILGADPDEQDFTPLLAGILTAGLDTLPLWWD
jgi:hypothetical protein